MTVPSFSRAAAPICSSNTRRTGARLIPLLLALVLPTAVGARQAERDSRFEALMSGARMVGQFTVDTGQADATPRADLYSVSELERGEDDVWVFHYTMSFGDNLGNTFDIPVRVVWADDTPMLTMTDQEVEGLGTFTVRVMIHGDRYAGTWQHGAFGGHMWGKIEREQDAAGDGAAPPAP
jgi:hypothetical protein